MQLNNGTPFSAQNVILPNEDGVDTLYTIVKASFKIGQQWTLADEQIPPQTKDEYWGEPAASSLKYSMDFHTGKASTDIVILGNACAGNNQPVRQLDVVVMVGDVHKTLRVFGDRYWNKGRATHPEEFQSMPLVYENAFGGQHIVDNQLQSLEQRNPVGKGYKGNRPALEMESLPLPNIEDPGQLIQSVSDTPEPSGLGFKAPHWSPRADYGGTFDENWQKKRAPYLPTDYDKRFQNAAHPDLIYPGFLLGGEEVSISHMHPGGTMGFLLPQINLKGRVKIAQKDYPLSFNMETLIIEPADMRLQMVWKASHVCNNDAQKVRLIDLVLTR